MTMTLSFSRRLMNDSQINMRDCLFMYHCVHSVLVDGLNIGE